MKRILIAIMLLLVPALGLAETVSITVTAPTEQITVQPQSTVITPEVVTVTATVNVTGTETVEVAIPGPQGPAVATTASVSSWNDLTDKPGEFPPSAHNQAISTVTDLQSALDGKATLNATVGFANVNVGSYGAINVGGEGGTNISNAAVDTGTMVSEYLLAFGAPENTRVHTIDVVDAVGHIHTLGNAHHMEADQLPGLAAVALSNSYPDLDDKPTIPQACVDVYDGRDGVAGPTGATGPAGKAVLNGSGAPGSGLGVDGDFYLDTANAHLYGPKAGGAWPGTYTELVGPQGPQGPPGASASVTQTAVLTALDDATDGAVLWVQQGATEQATDAKTGVKDRLGNAKQWIDSNGTMVRQCIASDSAPAFKMLSSAGAVIYSVACDNTMTFTGAVTIK